MERTRGNNMNWRSHVKEKIHLFISILTIFIVLLIGISVIQQVQLQSVKKESELLKNKFFLFVILFRLFHHQFVFHIFVLDIPRQTLIE